MRHLKTFLGLHESRALHPRLSRAMYDVRRPCTGQLQARALRAVTMPRYEHLVEYGRRSRKHGESAGAGNETPEYRAWTQMLDRCRRPRHPAFHRYGGRGIKVCERWAGSYEQFLADMGRRPSPRHSLDRIDNDGNYEPSNCRWATTKEQMRNRAANVRLTARGETLTLAEWSERTGVALDVLAKRAKRGLDSESVLIPRNLWRLDPAIVSRVRDLLSQKQLRHIDIAQQLGISKGSVLNISRGRFCGRK